LRRTHRLTGRTEFATALKRGRRSSETLFLVSVLANHIERARLGLGVSRRVSPKAVERNRIKRQIREVFRHCQQELHGLDVVVIAQAAAGACRNSELRTALRQQFMKMAPRCKKS
jgi:ribonuclease P protein component